MPSKYNLLKDQPPSFSKEEIEILHQIIHRLFDIASLNQLKTEFWHWLIKTVTGKFHNGSGQKESCDLVILYQKVEQLMESALIIYNQFKIKQNVSSFGSAVALLVPQIEAKGGEKLIKVMDAILAVTRPEKIFFINNSEDSNSNLTVKNSYHLLLVFSQHDRHLLSSYQGMVQELCKEIAVVTILIEEEDVLYKALRQGHLFYSPVCTGENLLFDTGKTMLPDTKLTAVDEIILKARAVFSRQFSRAEALVEGAHQYYLQNENELSCYLLHQAVAQCYRSILAALMGKVERTHNLYELRQYCTCITTTVNAPFLTNTEEGEEELFSLLQSANEDALYDEIFEVTDVAIEELIEKVTTLLEDIKAAFDNAVAVFERWINE